MRPNHLTNQGHHTLRYDGTFAGLLTCVFQIYERNLTQVSIISAGKRLSAHSAQEVMFTSSQEVVTDEKQSQRVETGLEKKLSKDGLRRLLAVFLSEIEGVEDTLLGYIRHVFASARSVKGDYGNPFVMEVSKVARMVYREAHRMEAFVRFRLTREGIYFANIEPDFDVLPLVSGHFFSRYADQKWMIYDLKRGYGVFYDLHSLEWVEIAFEGAFRGTQTSSQLFDESEGFFQELWKNYFRHTNIPSRKNTKLHLRHVPKRYWKYLSEKSV